MGLFDFRCSISGLSLRAADAVLVALVEVEPERWSPLSLPLVGTYDRGGSIDGFVPDFRSELFVRGFSRLARVGRVDAPGAGAEFDSFTRAPTIERLLHLFERVNTMSRWAPMPFTLDGCQLRQVLFHAECFAALAPATRPARAPEYEQLEEQLARAPVAPQARELFEEVIIGSDEVRAAASVALSQLTRLSGWLAANGRRWGPARESDQFCAPDDLRLARAARVELAWSPELSPVIDRVVAELERECASD